MVFLTSSIITLIIPLALIISGTMRKTKWNTYLKQKPLMQQRVMPISPPTSAIPPISTHPKFCPECGSKITEREQKFCGNCGREL